MRACRLLLVGLLATVAAGLGVPGPAVAAVPGGLAGLASCLQSRPVLHVLMVFDTSGSIPYTDPQNRRLTAADIALGQLDQLGRPGQPGRAPIDVSVRWAVFNTGFQALGDWHRPDPASRAADRAALRNAPLTGDTDYVIALRESRRLLAERAAQDTADVPPCQMLVWFTDGKFEPIDDKQPGFAERVAEGKDQLCRGGGVMDQLRQDGVNVITVGLVKGEDKPDEEFLRRISGVRPGCGTPATDAAGQYLRATDEKDLAKIFFGIGDPPANPPIKCEPVRLGCTFDLEEGLSGFTVLIEPGAPGVRVALDPPAGAVAPLPGPGRDTPVAVGGARLTWQWYGDDGNSLVIVRGALPSGDPSWAGRWTVRLLGAGAAGVTGSIHLFSDQLPRIEGTPHFVRNRPWTFDIRTRPSDVRLPAGPPGARPPELAVSVASPSDDKKPIAVRDVRRQAGDRWTATFTAPGDWHGSQVEVRLRLDVRTKAGFPIGPPEIVVPVPVTSSVTVVAPRFAALHGSDSRQAALTFTAGDAERCVWIDRGGLDLATVADVGPVAVRAEGSGRDRSNCLRVAAGRTATIDLTASFTEKRGWTGTVKGELTVRSAGSSGPDDELLVPVRLNVGPGGVAPEPPVWLALLCMLVMTALPLAGFALFNALALTRVDGRERQAARYRLRASWRPGTDRVELSEDGRPWRPTGDDFRPVTASRRSFRVGSIEFRARVPWRHPFHVARTGPVAGDRHVETRPVGGPSEPDFNCVAVAGRAAAPEPASADVEVPLDVAVVLDVHDRVTPQRITQIVEQAADAARNLLPRQRTESDPESRA
ncbi:vWA domain-containing protein [Actinoplanes sp. NPDC048988]|uniref:vWA domain-containing protein n=1 Tax=Actinoplanes sp. NPDC048988 TaxID=3363901 RepID=UPI00371D2070